MSLAPIDCEHYVAFAQDLFREYNKEITLTDIGSLCTPDRMEAAIQQIIAQQSFAYESLLYQLPPGNKRC